MEFYRRLHSNTEVTLYNEILVEILLVICYYKKHKYKDENNRKLTMIKDVHFAAVTVSTDHISEFKNQRPVNQIYKMENFYVTQIKNL